MKTVDDMSDDELRAALAEREQRSAPLPPPVNLDPELVERCENLTKLGTAVDVIVGFFNATVPDMNRQFWAAVKEKHPEVDMERWHWVAEDGCLLPKPKVTD